MTKQELRDIFHEKYILQPATYERLEEVCNLMIEYLASPNQEDFIYLVTSTGYGNDTIDEINLATHDEDEAKRFYAELEETSISWELHIYKIPMNVPSENHIEPFGKTTWLSDCIVEDT